MKTQSILLFVALFFGTCTMRTNQTTGSIYTVTDTSFIETNKNIADLLQKNHHTYTLEYCNDINCGGIGVVNPKEFNFQIIIDTINQQRLNIENIENQQYLVPIFWKPDYLIFYMPVIQISTKYYEVSVNKTMSVFVDKNEFDFFTWEELLEEKIVVIQSEEGYVEPNSQSQKKIINNTLDEIFFVVEKVEGNWILVREEMNELVIDKFWVLWRDENKLLIHPVFLM
ncbi:hypothetical protein FACS189430_11920 [Bacteroidia bacterium]|nr:hypothetical protein FACS189430_11920 [Bacteroidia bacterium]